MAIKVVHTYGNEVLEKTNYVRYLGRSKKASRKTMCKASLGGAMVFLILFALYAYAYYVGGRLRWEKKMNGDELYSAGSITAIMFSVIFGAFYLASSGPHMKAVSEGQIGGKLAYETINHKPKV